MLFARISPGLPRAALVVSLTTAAVLLAIAGCSADNPAPATRVITGGPAASTAATALRSPQAIRSSPLPWDRFVAAVQRQLPAVVIDHRDEEVAQIGELTCDSLAAGKAPAAIIGEISKYGVTAADARKLLDLARSTACPS